MRILVLGSGGREHALCWRLAQSGHEVVCTPGNGGIAANFDVGGVAIDDHEAIIEMASSSYDLVVIGPEVPLVAGLADRLRERGVAVFGPGADGARLEGSKRFCKEFFQRHGIPTGGYRSCSTMDEAKAAIAELGAQVVIKADGLAAGKGVVVCDGANEALDAAQTMLEGRKFGDASSSILVEERLFGRELSLMAITDGTRYQVLAIAEDHKAVFDDDKGPNTGGMGAVSPASWVSDELVQGMCSQVFEPTISGLRSDGVDFRGVLYAGLMITDEGPKMLEYNVRFGDPETQAVLPRLQGDFGALLHSAAIGALSDDELSWDPRTAVAVIMASPGYPESAKTGTTIIGLDECDALVFHAGTRASGETLVTSGGRVLAVVALDETTEAARARVYPELEKIRFDGAHYRRDIGARR